MRQPLTPAEIGLMRAIVTWRRETIDGVWPRGEFSTNRGWGHFLSWRRYTSASRTSVAVEVAHEGDDNHDRQLRLCVDTACRCGHETRTVEFEPGSVTEAVDALVALGVLPPRFSSAYRAGWEANEGLWGGSNATLDEREAAVEPLAPVRR